MTQQTDGNRRGDRVLAKDYLAGLTVLPLAELRARRDETAQEEVDVSYLRRLIQGRIDIIRAELARRAGGGTGSLLADLPQILGEGDRAAPHGLGRHVVIEPSRADEHRRHVESLVGDIDLSDVAANDDEALRRALVVFEHEEAALSTRRHALHDVLDRCNGEIARRYRDGEADVADLLAGP